MEDAGAEKCYICLSPFGEETVASLDACQHVFCLQCILQWSKTANTCPVDRISFTFIHPGGDAEKKIKVEAPKPADEDEDGAREAVNCEECGRSDRRHRLLVCVHCDSGFHMNCLPPSSSTSTSEGDWICPDCVVTPHQAGEEISDGELTDLLAEADEVPSTSSRLRPSTLNQPGSRVRRRHSLRLRRGTAIDADTPPQTSWHVPKYLIRASKPTGAAEAPAALHHQRDAAETPARIKTRKRKK